MIEIKRDKELQKMISWTATMANVIRVAHHGKSTDFDSLLKSIASLGDKKKEPNQEDMDNHFDYLEGKING